MKRPRRDWEERLARNVQRTTVTVAFLLGSLPAEFWLGSRALVMACYAGAAIAAVALLAYLFDKRLWVERPPTQ